MTAEESNLIDCNFRVTLFLHGVGVAFQHRSGNPQGRNLSVWICGRDGNGKPYVRDAARAMVAAMFPDYRIRELDVMAHCVRRKPKTKGAAK